MEYRGKHYTIVHGVGPDSWKWKVQLDEKNVKTGEAKSRDAARTTVIWLIDRGADVNKGKAGPARRLRGAMSQRPGLAVFLHIGWNKIRSSA